VIVVIVIIWSNFYLKTSWYFYSQSLRKSLWLLKSIGFGLLVIRVTLDQRDHIKRSFLYLFERLCEGTPSFDLKSLKSLISEMQQKYLKFKLKCNDKSSGEKSRTHFVLICSFCFRSRSAIGLHLRSDDDDAVFKCLTHLVRILSNNYSKLTLEKLNLNVEYRIFSTMEKS
jgi:hypothetical protein